MVWESKPTDSEARRVGQAFQLNGSDQGQKGGLGQRWWGGNKYRSKSKIQIKRLKEIKKMANQDFFLSPDDSQTLGNINFMRKSVRVRHTFPKTVKNPKGFEVEKEISSLEEFVPEL